MWTGLIAFALVAARSLEAFAASTPNPKTLTTSFPDPNDDPFYSIPRNIGSFHPGQVLRNRLVATTVTGRTVKSYQVFYRTTDHQNKAVGTVATIWEPAIPLDPPKIFSYQDAEDALNLDCAPSWAWVNESSVLEVDLQSDGSIIIPWALSQGYYVVSADFEGHKSAWLVGLMEGRGVLDGIRSVINFFSLRHAEAALYGYSGGGHASVWASSLAAKYAPEVKLVGAAFGGTPVDLLSAYKLLNGSPEALLAGGAIFGLASGYPELSATLNSLLTANGKAIAAKLVSENYCINAHQHDFANFDFGTLFKTNFLDNSVVKKVLAEESLLMNVSSLTVPVPKFPRFEWHGTGDVTVPYAPEAQYVQQQCAKGADIRFVTFPELDHSNAYLSGVPGALLFIAEAFGGALTKVPCGTNIAVPAVGSLEAVGLLGVDANIVLSALLAEGF
ncbi:lipase a [Acrodontium crateriforme]|uniref:Lipase a n=1 Tax=Acrodontium crateriforme TaxID=150365 RepID=A0AAQ3M7E4_9PEZI|nr:lipase a [Acrodontium crateriforme]